MIRVLKTALVVIVLNALFLGCHKYSEDPFISFRRPAKRIEGTWNITSYQVWGKEHSHDFDSLLSPRTLTDLCIHFASYGNFNYNANNETGGAWAFVDKNNNALALFPKSIFGDNQYIFDSPDNMELIYPDETYLQRDSTFLKLDSTFFNLFLYRNTNPVKTSWASTWKIVELYGKNFHISNNGIDIYFKKQ